MKLKDQNEEFLAAIDNHKGIIYKISGFYCSDEEVRKDLIQEIILQLWRAYPRYNNQFKLSTWIYRISLNVSISFYTREKRRSEIAVPLPDALIGVRQDQDTLISGDESQLNLLNQFIQELKEMDKALMILYLEGNNHTEISRILGISKTNVSTRVGRIKEQLKKRFDEFNIYKHE